MSRRSSGGSDGYALGRSEAETERLIVQHQLFGHLTRQFFVAAGITKGMQVLDLGSGAGDVALTLVELLGPQGTVIGVDLNADILDTARYRVANVGWSNVEFHHGDVHELDVGNEFDAVVGRWVLMYVPDPAELLRTVAARVRRGGIVAFQESDLRNPLRLYPPVPLHEQVTRWTTPPPGATGPDIEMRPESVPDLSRCRPTSAATARRRGDRRRSRLARLPISCGHGSQPVAVPRADRRSDGR